MSTGARTDLPTLTEVVDLAAKAAERLRTGEAAAPARAEPYLPPASAPLASAPAPAPALAYDEELVAQVMVRLQPRLEAWVEAQVRRALMEMLPVWAESASLSIVRELRAEMPELLSVALDEVHRQRHG